MSDEVSRRTRADELDDLNARIAALEAQIARMGAAVSADEARNAVQVYCSTARRMLDRDGMQAALTAFLEGRVKG